MSQPFDSCRLYFLLRDRAWAHPGSATHGTYGLIDLDQELEHPGDVGLSRDQVQTAMRGLMEASLVHEVTAQEEQRFGLEHHAHRLFVEAVDDLTAATLLLSRC